MMENAKKLVSVAVGIFILGGLLGCRPGANNQTIFGSTPSLIPPSTVSAQDTYTAKPEVTMSPTVGISPEEAAQLLPLYPSQVTVEMVKDAVVLKWRGTGEDIIRYEVFRKFNGAKDWQPLGSVPKVGENRGSYEWRDTTTKSGVVYIYGVAAVNAYGSKSSISESVVIAAP